MNVTVIPFLLLAEIASNGDWQNGPLINMTMETKMLFSNLTDGDKIARNITGSILCQPKADNYLSCYTRNFISLQKDYNPDGDVVREFTRSEPQMFPFELGFHEKGVDHILIPSNARTDLFSVRLKHIANLLTIGTNLKGKEEEGNFDEIEDYKVGKCNMKIQTIRSVKPIRMMVEKDFNLKFVPFPQEKDEITRVLKSRDDCLDLAQRYFSSEGFMDVTDLTYFSSDMMFTDKHFESYGRYDIKTESKFPNSKYDIIESMHLKLESITPAEEQVKPLENLIKTNVLDISK